MAMNVKIIKNAEDYEAAMARLSALMTLDPKANSKEENELELLALVIQDFERQIVPPVKADPIEAILFRMDQMQLSRKDLIPYIGSISKVSEVLSRKRPLSLPMIRRLNQGLGIPADILIEDVETDSSVVEQEPEMDFTRFPLKEMLERGCFGDFEGNAQRLKEYAEDLVRKFMQDLLPKQVSPPMRWPSWLGGCASCNRRERSTLSESTSTEPSHRPGCVSWRSSPLSMRVRNLPASTSPVTASRSSL
jgi:HTH-type transcriptional regulator / antitoxin HigA